MPNYKEHQKSGAWAGGVEGFAQSIQRQRLLQQMNPNHQFDFWQVIIETGASAIIGAFSAAIPDILEPATHPNHRGTFHSATVLGMTAYGCVKAIENPFGANAWLGPAFAGYSSHIVEDAQTPYGIRLL